ncbi:MAG: choice-of-anchor Q domain-containing protein [Bacteroidota bacterium]
MKKTVYSFINCFMLVMLGTCAYAATSITMPTVSGHWTMAGSPYKIYNNVKVDSMQSLTIDPGVEVVFYGSYRFLVYGTLKASGSATQRIKFYVADTTGFSTNLTSAAGGWHGIQFPAYGGTGTDSTTLQYCDISYTKFDSVDQYANPWLNTVYINRSMSMKNCNLFKNNTPKFLNYGLLFLYSPSASPVTFEMSGCEVSGNNSPSGLFWINGGNMYLHDNKIHHNRSGLSLIRADYTSMLFEKNEFHDNVSVREESACAAFLLVGRKASSIRNNKIYNNESEMAAALTIGGGKVDIIGNYLANNHHRNGLCGWADGGGAIQLSTNWTGIDADSTVYNVRNNVFANNYSPLYGAGINVINATTNIVNNHFVNNNSETGSCVYINNFTTSYPAVVKNNLFFGNTDGTETAANSTDVHVYNGGSVTYERNWSMHHPHEAFATPTMGFTLAGDTASNVVGTTPGLVSTTLTSNYTESALGADFRLLAGSPCINAGNIIGITTDPTDYAGNSRINGSAIDIGAYEYTQTAAAPGAYTSAARVEVYPNPATNLIFVSTPKASGTIALLDISGRSVATQNVTYTLTSFDITALPRGVYFASWSNGNGESAVQKIVVE